VQAVVREAYEVTVAEQDSVHRKPAEFAEAWRARLAFLLEQDSVELPGWSVITAADLDTSLAWRLYEAASYARRHAVERAKPTRSQRAQLAGTQAQVFEFEVVSEGETLGEVRYGICPPCGAGLLYKISFDPDFQFCGLGRLALGQLEARHPGLTWYTTGQFKDARGFFRTVTASTATAPGLTGSTPAPILTSHGSSRARATGWACNAGLWRTRPAWSNSTP